MIKNQRIGKVQSPETTKLLPTLDASEVCGQETSFLRAQQIPVDQVVAASTVMTVATAWIDLTDQEKVQKARALVNTRPVPNSIQTSAVKLKPGLHTHTYYRGFPIQGPTLSKTPMKFGPAKPKTPMILSRAESKTPTIRILVWCPEYLPESHLEAV